MGAVLEGGDLNTGGHNERLIKTLHQLYSCPPMVQHVMTHCDPMVQPESEEEETHLNSSLH